MKILMVTNNYTPYSGGVVSSINATIALLQQAGHEGRIVTLDFGTHEEDPHYVQRLYCPFRYHSSRPLALAWRPNAQLDALVDDFKPDIIHTHHPFLLGSAAQKVACKRAISVILTYHTVYENFAWYKGLFPYSLVKPCIQKITNSYCQKIQGIIAPSYYVKQRLINNHVQKPIEVIPSMPCASFYEEHFIPKGTFQGRHFTLLTVSRFAPEKNIPFLLDMVSMLPSSCFNCIIAGFGPHEQYLKNYAYNHKKLLPSLVKFVIKPTKQELVQLYKNADVFVFASQAETQGLVVSEALACGTPVIALDGPGVNEVVKDGYNGFLVTNQKEMAQKVKWISDHAKEWEKMQKNAFETMQKDRSEDGCQKLINFYEKVLNYGK